MKENSRFAYAKINLSLDVLKRRADGYHDVAMVLHQISLADRVSLCLTDTPGIMLTSDSGAIPLNEKNIAYRAAALMLERFHLNAGVYIHIEKNIPVAGGLAGGSTDAAAVLCLMNDLFSLGLTQKNLMDIGLMLGADVPYCIFGRPALAEGIGEKLTPISGLPPCKILIVNPGIEVSTKEIYEEMDSREPGGRVDNYRLIRALEQEDLSAAAVFMENVMQPVSAEKCPRIIDILQAMEAMGAIHAMMSGSGATCFGLFDENANLTCAAKAFPGYLVKIAMPHGGK